MATRILFSNPPYDTAKGYPTISQNRQFQYFRNPTHIYPVIPATAASLLQAKGFEVDWVDSIIEGQTEVDWETMIYGGNYDYVFIEVKTPIIDEANRFCRIIHRLTNDKTKTIMYGDHVKARPQDSKATEVASNAHLDKWVAKFFEFEYELVHIDRELTKWLDYAYDNGNFKYLPGAYIMSSRDCWYGKCSFCSWAYYFDDDKPMQIPVEYCLDEIKDLIDRGCKEVFDDAGTVMGGKWMHEFCRGMVDRGYNKKISLGCNMRIDMDPRMFPMMKEAGFRLILVGIESINKRTCDILNKHIHPDRAEHFLKEATRCGLYPHITTMFGYPWETLGEERRTRDFCLRLMKNGTIYSLQATTCMPYPNTGLWEYCKENGWILSETWEEYHMGFPVITLRYPVSELKKLLKSVYRVRYNPRQLWQKFKRLKDIEDIKYGLRIFKKLGGI